jgi:type II secretory pathway predicted ATPase ExeA
LLLSTAQHKQLVEALLTAARKSFPLVTLTGPEGVGKTVFIHRLVAATPPDLAVGELSTESVERNGLIRVTTSDEPATTFEIGASIPDKFMVFLEGQRRLSRHLLLIMDNAEKVTDDVVDALNSLVQLRSDGVPSLTMLLAGSPDLLPLLYGPEFGTLIRQRGVNFRFLPMTAEETAAYVRQRLKTANLNTETFEETAVEAIHQEAGGLPKQVNMLCSLAMAAMSREGKQTVDRARIDVLIDQVHGKKEPRKATKGAPIESASEAEQQKEKTLNVEEIPEEYDHIHQFIKPCEFVFLARDQPEAFSPEIRPRIIHRSDSGRSVTAGVSSRPARDGPSRPALVSHYGRVPPDLTQDSVASADALSAQTPIATPTPTRRLSLFAGGRPAYSLLSGVAAVALVGFVVLSTIGGEYSGDSPLGESGDPDAFGTAALSTSGPPSAVDLSSPARDPMDVSVLRDATDDAVLLSQPGGRGADPGPAEVWQDTGGWLENSVFAVGGSGTAPPDRDGAVRLFRKGLELSVQDPTAAAVAFSRAAIRGHSRSAYYLGQIYETGDGVPADNALAREWYVLAGDLARARERLDEISERRGIFEERSDTSRGATVQLTFAERSETGVIDLVWTGSLGTGSTGYVVELAEEPNALPVLRAIASVSALRLLYPDVNEVWWRVVAGEGSIASDWQRVPSAD